MDHTVLPANHTIPASTMFRSPDGAVLRLHLLTPKGWKTEYS